MGIIPAHAGNTLSNAVPAVASRDHPRACGEHGGERINVLRKSGSSPRMRGTRGPEMAYNDMRGIIPAHAGNTYRPATTLFHHGDHPRACGEHAPPRVTRRGCPGDHPRACGEHSRPWPLGAFYEGSSPRMRGTPARMALLLSALGIIPAHAGNTAR